MPPVDLTATYQADVPKVFRELIVESDHRWERRVAVMNAEWELRLSKLRAELLQWMFTFWVAPTFAVIAVLVIIVRL